jgi:hypothetical protein
MSNGRCANFGGGFVPKDNNLSFLTSKGVTTCATTSSPNVVTLTQTTGLSNEVYNLSPSGPMTYYTFPETIPMQNGKTFDLFVDTKNCKMGDMICFYAHITPLPVNDDQIMAFQFLPTDATSPWYFTNCGGAFGGGIYFGSFRSRICKYFSFDGQVLIDNGSGC